MEACNKNGLKRIRKDGRSSGQLREVKIATDYLKHPEGSVLIEIGDTKVICTATVETSVPPFLRGQRSGWITAEYSMLPRSTHSRSQREAARGKLGGRTHEIQRLIGRSLRAVTDMEKLGERTVWIDCDVIQADGGTRTASITGAYVALCGAMSKLQNDGVIEKSPLTDSLAAVSVGVVDGEVCLDLNYDEDSRASVDMNFVMTGSGMYVEIQGTAEEAPFSGKDMDRMRSLAESGIMQITGFQRKALED